MNRLVTLVGVLLLMSGMVPMVAAQTPEGTPVSRDNEWQIADVQALEVDGEIATLSPDGQWLAGVGPGEVFCVWDVESLTPTCAGEDLPIRLDTLVWSPDSTAVAFSLDAIEQLYDSDLYLYELDEGALTNLTDDGYAVDAKIVQMLDDAPIDDVPAWSPDSRQLAFVRSYFSDAGKSTAIMRIDRGGGDPIEIVQVDSDAPVTVYSPMFWLPDDTILYSRDSIRDEGRDGVWRVGVDGSGSEQVVPGVEAATIPSAAIASVSADGSVASIYSLGWDQPERFWILDLSDGSIVRLPPRIYVKGSFAPGGVMGPSEVSMAFQTGPAAVSPDGSMVFLLYSSRSERGGNYFRMMNQEGYDLLGGQLQSDVVFAPVAPHWAANNTILVRSREGPMLLTLEQVP